MLRILEANFILLILDPIFFQLNNFRKEEEICGPKSKVSQHH